MARISTVLGFALLLAAAPVHAVSTTYVLTMDGSQEVPGPGDPDGSASGTITLDDVTGEISWSITYANLAAPTAMHIHPGAAGSFGGVFVGLGVATSGGPGTLISSTTTTPANIATIFANPANFYVNIHTGEFTAGAVRGQLGTVIPEPATAVLVGIGLLALVSRRRINR